MDLDAYNKGTFINTMGRMYGSSRFMAPEEFTLGANIDFQTTVYHMGATVFELLGTGKKEPEVRFRGNEKLFNVALKAIQTDKKDRYSSVQEFCSDWFVALDDVSEVSKMLTILVNRDSVCMGDDVDDHQISIHIDENMNFEELFRLLIDNRYLPNIHGNDVVWVLSHKDEELLSYVTLFDKMYSCFTNCMPRVSSKIHSNEIIYFKYFSSKLNRAEYLFKKFEGQKFHIWHEGYMKEYKSYNISLHQEECWKSAIK